MEDLFNAQGTNGAQAGGAPDQTGAPQQSTAQPAAGQPGDAQAANPQGAPAQGAAGQTGSGAAGSPQLGPGSRALGALVSRSFGSADASLSADDRKTLVSAIAQRAHVSEADAERKVAELEKRAEQARQEFKSAVERFQREAREAADTAARRLAQAAWLSFAASILGGGAAALGGILGNTSARFVRRVSTRTDAGRPGIPVPST